MRDTYIIEALRTPFASLGGELSEVEAPKLAAAVFTAILEKTKLSSEQINEVIMGQVLLGGAGQAPARQAMRYAGIPDKVHALTVNKVCGSGLKSIMLGANSIQCSESEVVLAGGMENMSLAPYFLRKARAGFRLGHGEILDMLVFDGLTDPYSGKHMGELAEISVDRHRITREEQDAFAIESYKRAQAAVKNGTFKSEIVPVTKVSRSGNIIISDDEEPNKIDFDKLSKLRPVFKKDGTITAANASSINDGAAAVLLASADACKNLNLVPRARIVAQATASINPEHFSEAPVEAIKAVCKKANLNISDIDLFEVNEAFASVTLIAQKQLNIAANRLNVNGGAVALGHPIGASGARLIATLVRELHQRQQKYGLATLCIGGGEAVAMIIERV